MLHRYCIPPYISPFLVILKAQKCIDLALDQILFLQGSQSREIATFMFHDRSVPQLLQALRDMRAWAAGRCSCFKAARLTEGSPAFCGLLPEESSRRSQRPSLCLNVTCRHLSGVCLEPVMTHGLRVDSMNTCLEHLASASSTSMEGLWAHSWPDFTSKSLRQSSR